MSSEKVMKIVGLSIVCFVVLGIVFSVTSAFNTTRNNYNNSIKIDVSASSETAQTDGQNINEATQNTEEEVLEGTVLKVVEEKETDSPSGKQIIQKLQINITKGSLKDKTVEFENGSLSATSATNKYKVGDKVVLTFIKDPQGQGNDIFVITDYQRRGALLLLFVVFVIFTLAIAKTRGLFSLLGMGASFLIIFKFVLPQILAGKDPILISILASMLIIPITFYLSHGFNKKTSIAVVGTIISLVVTGVMATIFVNLSHITGSSSEEAAFLNLAKQGTFNLKGMLLAGIIIGSLGILDDITISQAAIVQELKDTSKNISFNELYKRSMKIGSDHIASLVNTLILVYTGAALPLLVLFINNTTPLSQAINYEMVAEEMVRTLVGSIGLILAVPITSLLAAWVSDKSKA